MSFTLAELEATVMQLPYADAGAYTTPNSAVVHRACRYAINRWLRETKCSRTTASVPVADGATSVNIVTTAADFSPGCLTGPILIDGEEEILTLVNPTLLESRRNTGTDTTGKPRLIAFYSETDAQLYPESDDDYTLKVPYWRSKIAFTPGDTGSGITIYIDDTYLGDIAMGALAYLHLEFPERRSAQSMALFEAAIKRARGQLAANGLHMTERYRGFDNTHMNDQFL